MNIEKRYTSEILSEGDIVMGKAIAFNVPSDNLSFVEVIDRNAITEETLSISDVFARFNHDDNYILARNRHNDPNASLKLEIREDGLYYSFSLPDTEKAREVRSHIERHELGGSSFSFVVGEDELEIRSDGTRVRKIKSIKYLHDVAPVFTPAYEATNVDLRNSEEIKEIERRFAELENENNVEDNENKQVTEEVTEQTTETSEQNGNTDNVNSSDDANDNVNNVDSTGEDEELEEERNENDNVDLDIDNDNNGVEDNDQIEETTEEVEDNNDNNEKRNNNIIMNKKFRLIDALNKIVANEPLDAVSSAVNRCGMQKMSEGGISTTGQLCIPLETRDGEITVTTEGENTVGVDIFDIQKPLQARLVFGEAGARFLNGLSSDVVVPVMGAGNAEWTDEIADADSAGITFDSVKLQPKRLSTYIDISRKFLIQSSDSAEAYIREEIINAIAQKLESTILGNTAETTTAPGGIWYDVTPTEVADFADLTDFEADLDDANVGGNRKYIVTNKAKAYFRNMTKGSSLALVWQGNEIDGTPALATSNAGAGKKFVYGDWSNLIIASFGSLELTTDTITQARKGMVRLVVNAYYDAKVCRPTAFAFGEISE